MRDDWVHELKQLNGRLMDALSAGRLGSREERRRVLREQVGQIRPLRRLDAAAMKAVLAGRVMVGVDGSVNTYGGQYPYYVDLIRALAKPTEGEPVIRRRIHCPMPPADSADEETASRTDSDLRQRLLAELEVEAAQAAIKAHRPSVLVMDGPLVRFDMRTRESFINLCKNAISENILLLGCIENIESRVIGEVLGEQVPAGWRNRYDRDLLWGTLKYGEVLEVGAAAKGSQDRYQAGSDPPSALSFPIRTWFLRSAHDPAVIGLDILEAQADRAGPVADLLFTLSPPDGRGIPVWLDLVDREVRLTQTELEAYMQFLDPEVKRVLAAKRDQRVF